ncbi:MutS 4 [Mycena sanguinolenta]|uniref:MutS 4 n=1 Tax=Mycena sanguinolenta TaxID=230812 RepID=A0A8H7DFI7_9AGAR|nr:MutS 4 [Mycena sanguinolenta]
MHLHPPVLILVPDTFLSASDVSPSCMLVEYIYEEFPGIPVEPIGRKYWNEAGGLEFISQLCVEDDERAGTLLAVANKYYALSAACALFKHAETKLNTRFASGSLRIRYVPVEGTMMIDPETARNLELVGNMSYKKVNALALWMSWKASSRTLVVLYSPHKCSELVHSEERFTDVRAGLKPLNRMDFDKLIACLAASETKPTNSAKPAAARVSQMLDLRNVVRNLPALQKALEGSQSQLLKIIQEMLSDERLAKIERLVCANLNEDGALAKGGIAAVNARVPIANRLLDVARETYKENVGDIFALNRTLSETHGLPLSLIYQETGFVFTLRKTDLEGELPRGFINATLKKGKWTFTSMDLKKMNARMKDALDETFILSEKIIQDLVAEILVDVGVLYKASEAVALLDMLWSFAHTSIMHNYVRPEFTGTLAIKSGRHPVLETVKSAGTLVPNDVYCDDSSSFQIVQGPNLHLSVQRSSKSGADFGVTFQYKIVDGAPQESNHYGLELARLADLPNDVLVEGKRVAKKLAALHARRQEKSESSRIAMRRKALLRLRTQLTQALDHSALPDEELLAYIGRFQVDIAKAFLHPSSKTSSDP